VQLGFFETPEQNELLLFQEGNWNKWDGGVAGGLPIWLFPHDGVKCLGCDASMSFLLQLYAPLDDNENAFHRVLYVFVCRTCSDQITVLRGQLPQLNEFYVECCQGDDNVPSPNTNPLATKPSIEKLFSRKIIVVEREMAVVKNACYVCGVQTKTACSSCHSVHYCSKEHQKEHWPKHKEVCKMLRKSQQMNSIDDDEDDENFTQDDLDKTVAGNDLNALASLRNSKSNAFDRFQVRVSREREQCIRYCRWPSDSLEDDLEEDWNSKGPLWLSDVNQCSIIPLCEHCGVERKFEVQILPQSLHYLEELEIDFGTICIYTCVNSCGDGGIYIPEFCFIQHVK